MQTTTVSKARSNLFTLVHKASLPGSAPIRLVSAYEKHDPVILISEALWEQIATAIPPILMDTLRKQAQKRSKE
jgi:PHD/YefM family antitoxin component YafN of YafNO toxin-antitoxin module